MKSGRYTSQQSPPVTAASKTKHPRLFYGWWIVIASIGIILYNAGIVTFGFTAIFEPITREFGWSYTQVSLAASLRGLETSLISPLVGFMVDRFGARKLVIVGNIILFSGLVLLSRTSSLTMFYMVYILISAGMSFCQSIVLITAVINWFHEKAGIATGLLMCGMGLGGLMVPVVTKLVDTLQWRPAMLVLGAGILLFSIPLGLVIRQHPEPYGYRPYGETSAPGSTGQPNTVPVSKQGVSAGHAIRSRVFWQIALSSMLHTCAVGAVNTHIMPYLGSIGIARSTASFIALIMPLVSVPSRLGAGWLGERVDRRIIYVSGFLTLSLSLLLLSRVGSVGLWLLALSILFFSYGWGSNVTNRMVLTRDYFGRSNYGSIVGLAAGVQMIGHMAGPPTAGWFFDTYGNYDGAWLFLAVITAIGMLLVLTLPSVKQQFSAKKPLKSTA